MASLCSHNFSTMQGGHLSARARNVPANICAFFFFLIETHSPLISIVPLISGSVTRWLVYCFNIWPFATLNICPKPYKICQSKFNKLPNSKWTFPKYQSFITLGQRGEISPNLDTLIVNNLVFWSRQMNKCEPLQITNIFQQQQNPLIFTWLTTSIQRILT